MVTGLGAILLISRDAAALASFYRSVLDLPLEEERHEGVPLHYGCEIGGVHFAIHPAETWPGEAAANPLSPVLVFATEDAEAAFAQLEREGCPATPPYDHGFGILVSFRDPEGHNVQLLQMTPS